MAYNTPESVADYLSRFQMQVTERTKGTFSPMHVKYSLALKMGSSSFERSPTCRISSTLTAATTFLLLAA